MTSSRESDARIASAASRSTATVLSPANLMTAPGGGGITPHSFLEVPHDHDSHLSISPLSADHVFFQQHHHPHPATSKGYIFLLILVNQGWNCKFNCKIENWKPIIYVL